MTSIDLSGGMAICYNTLVPGAEAVARRLAEQADHGGRAAWIHPLPEPQAEKASEPFEHLLDQASVLVCVGGDGTVLHAAAFAAVHRTPIFGVRMGRLGFLTETTEDEAQDALARLLDGEIRIERHHMIQASVGEAPPYHALNDIVIGRATLGRTISVAARIDGVLLAEYRADALVMSTATGSTGYALSAGGPILHPASDEMVLVPVAPHLTRSNALVLPGETRLRLAVERGYEAMMTVDGLEQCAIESGMVVEVTRSPRNVEFVRLGGPNEFYGNLARRLGWLRQDHVVREPGTGDAGDSSSTDRGT